jgi:trans-2,3-dihydro-3-hydroxyanthranilate isomerase
MWSAPVSACGYPYARGLDFRHVDVFTDRPYAGNGLIVVFGGTGLRAEELLAIAREMRQFESIFVDLDAGRDVVTARVFTVEEELPFAGHPLIGAAAALHERIAPADAERSWVFAVAGRTLEVASHHHGDHYAAAMNQGRPTISAPLPTSTAAEFARVLNLKPGGARELPTQVVSTGLPYLIVPATADALSGARIVVDDLEARLAGVGAKFVYAFDPDRREGRTWDNSGVVEDVATGSAAGPAAAYLVEHELARPNEEIVLRQGRFAGRPSTMSVEPRADANLWVGGPVAPVARGRLDALGSVGDSAGPG